MILALQYVLLSLKQLVGCWLLLGVVRHVRSKTHQSHHRFSVSPDVQDARVRVVLLVTRLSELLAVPLVPTAKFHPTVLSLQASL